MRTPDDGFNSASPQIPEGWQPIETAPKNGSTILLTDGDVIADGGWRAKCWAWPYTYRNPTHWMPAPPTPQLPKEVT